MKKECRKYVAFFSRVSAEFVSVSKMHLNKLRHVEVTMHPFILAFIGGAMIGLSATILLMFEGRIFGVSGLLGNILYREPGKWRWFILIGLLAAGLFTAVIYPTAFVITVERPVPLVVLAGLLVGFGTQLGSGCTSGHGVCGISRLSLRSTAATMSFIAAGALTVVLYRIMLG